MKEAFYTIMMCALISFENCLGVKHCTGVNCPRLDHCIEEVLEIGTCCATCLQRGCMCEGYQYYDCSMAGFKNGKVPEGESYLVDSGSTECWCPAGGGRISCRFIQCPDVPPYCIQLSNSTETCPHCLRFGCIYKNQKYEAGHSFQMDPCQICHCPNDGGNLMCSVIPDCSSETAKELHISKRPGNVITFLSNSVPIYTENTSEQSEDYNYFPEDPTSPYSFNPSSETKDKHDIPYEDTRKELKETLGTYYTQSNREEDPVNSPNSTTIKKESGSSQTSLSQMETIVRYTQVPPEETMRNGTNPENLHTIPELNTVPHLQFISTTSPPVNVREHEDHRQPQTLDRYHQDHQERNALNQIAEKQSVTSMDISVYCLAGESWASTHGHCSNMLPMTAEPGSTGWWVQNQCCVSTLRESQCLSGVNTARRGRDCGADDGEICDSYMECCKCCALGLRLQERRESCDPPHALGEICIHALRTCCEGMVMANRTIVRERTHPRATSPPRRVSEGPEHHAFSLEEVEDSENLVEKVEDVDECRVYTGQLCHHQCVNTLGSYVCVCFPGFTLQSDGIQCLQKVMDEDASELKEDNVMTDMSNIPPPDLPDPCEGNGHCAHHCHTVEGRAHCACFPGFSLMPDGYSCEDVDECFLSTHSCLVNERCVNNVGSFACLQQIVCPSGHQLNNDLCEDVNECTLGSHSCSPGFDCINTVGSFTCRARISCPGGFSHDSRGQCVDTDECRTVTQPCSLGFNCINTIGSYTCQRKIILCSRGYHSSADDTRCIDIDECETGVHRCGDGQICYNLPGTYRCDCHSGYQFDAYRRMCVDVNECWRYSGRLCSQTCENTPGSYRCSCSSGFILSSNGKNCEDVNECLSSPCSHECVNIYGSYQCYCRQGYYVHEDAHTCEDIDECTQNVGQLCTYKCVNVPGGYDCTCPEHGYSMAPNRRSCQDIDECTVGAHNCTAQQTCYNIHGGFRCLSFSCPTNYQRVSDTRCDRIRCSNIVECQNTPARITYYKLSFQTNIIIPALVFRMGPSPAFSGDNIIISITSGNQEGYFSPRKLNVYTGAIYLQRQLPQPRDFLLDVEMKLWRQGTFTTFLARIYIFITANII